jgi:hypothetical protein
MRTTSSLAPISRISCLRLVLGVLAIAGLGAARDASAQAGCAPEPPSGVVSWWRAEGNVGDAIGSNHGALVGDTDFAPGRFGQAFRFDGDADAVDVGSPASLHLGDQFTITAWVKKSPPPLRHQCGMWVAGFDCDGWAVVIGGNCGGAGDEEVVFTHVCYSGVGGGPSVEDSDGEWHHVAVSKSGSTVSFYLDGQKTTRSYGPSFGFGSSFGIGASAGRLSEGFSGLIDEVMVFARVLSDAEVQALGAPGGTSSDLAGWWRLDGDAADALGASPGVLLGGSFVAGKHGQALDLDAFGQGVQVPASAALDIEDAFTIEAWIRPGGASFGPSAHPGPGPIAEFYDTISFFQHPGTSDLHAALRKEDGNIVALDAPGVVAGGAFNHAVLTYSRASGVARIYANGALAVEGQVGALDTGTLEDLYIGQRAPGAFQQSGVGYHGTIDEVAVYRRDLGAEEVQALFDAGGAGPCGGAGGGGDDPQCAADLAACETARDIAAAALAACETARGNAESALAAKATELAGAQSQIAEAHAALDALEAHLQEQFGPGARIPGATLGERVRAPTAAVRAQNRGRKLGIHEALGGKPGR